MPFINERVKLFEKLFHCLVTFYIKACLVVIPLLTLIVEQSQISIEMMEENA
jgi:hypothetical protein